MYLHSNDLLNPIPTGHGRNQPIYERHVTKSGRNRVNLTVARKKKKFKKNLKKKIEIFFFF